ncbi:MAG: hypothetical protein ABMA64_03115 [Myxococcota bacterium]
MTYAPAFTELFLGALVGMGWGWWLAKRGFPWVFRVTLVALGLAGLGELAAGALVLTGDPAVVDSAALAVARWAPFAAIGATLALEGVLTAVVFMRWS